MNTNRTAKNFYVLKTSDCMREVYLAEDAEKVLIGYVVLFDQHWYPLDVTHGGRLGHCFDVLHMAIAQLKKWHGMVVEDEQSTR